MSTATALNLLYQYTAHKASEIDRNALKKHIIDTYNLSNGADWFKTMIANVKIEVPKNDKTQYHSTRSMKEFADSFKRGKTFYLQNLNKPQGQQEANPEWFTKSFPNLDASQLFLCDADISQFRKSGTSDAVLQQLGIVDAPKKKITSIATQMKKLKLKFGQVLLTDELIELLINNGLLIRQVQPQVPAAGIAKFE